MIGHDIERAGRLSVRENRSRDRVTEKLGYNLFHRASSECSVKAVADEKLRPEGLLDRSLDRGVRRGL
jgi:hypothetical protein